MYSYFYVHVFLFLCMYRSRYCVSLCCSMYCLCVNVYVLMPQGVNPTAVNKMYHLMYVWRCIFYENEERKQLDATTVIYYHKLSLHVSGTYMPFFRSTYWTPYAVTYNLYSWRWTYRCPKYVEIICGNKSQLLHQAGSSSQNISYHFISYHINYLHFFVKFEFHCFTVHFDSLSFIHTNSCTFSYNHVLVF